MSLRIQSALFLLFCFGCCCCRPSMARVAAGGAAEDEAAKAAEEAPNLWTYPLPVDAASAEASASLRRGPGPKPALTMEQMKSLLNRTREAFQGSEARSWGRNLLYNGRPTGGNKYPSLVSIWVGNESHVSSIVSFRSLLAFIHAYSLILSRAINPDARARPIVTG
jgi:hypothetical protein